MRTMKTTFLLMTVAATGLFAQPLPDGPGKDLVESQCGSCHGLEQVQAHRDTQEGWQSLVDYMVSRGMAATDAEVKTMVEYLVKAYPAPPKPEKGKAKANAKLVAKAKKPVKPAAKVVAKPVVANAVVTAKK